MKIQREVLAVRKRVLGAEHPDIFTVADYLALYLSLGCVWVCFCVCAKDSTRRRSRWSTRCLYWEREYAMARGCFLLL